MLEIVKEYEREDEKFIPFIYGTFSAMIIARIFPVLLLSIIILCSTIIVCKEPVLQDAPKLKTYIESKQRSKSEKDPESCAICMDNFRDGVVDLDCGHVLHVKCILKWSDKK